MTRALLDPQAADRLAKLAGLFGSNHDGEVVNAARQADKLVRTLGLSWFDVIVRRAAAPEWQAMAKALRDRVDDLDPREADFIANVARSRRPPSPKQMEWLTDIFERVSR